LYRVTKSYGYFVKDKIEPPLIAWLKENIKGPYRIIETRLHHPTMTKSIEIEFIEKADALRFASLRIPVDLYRKRIEEIRKRGFR